ncbi:MAG: CHAT domain-containing protein, partial [Blastocatellia bacterium]
QALEPSAGRFLIEDRNVSYAPSIQMLSQFVEDRSRLTDAPGSAGRLLLVSRPAVSPDTLALVNLTDPAYRPSPSAEAGSEELPSSEKPAGSIHVLSGSNATETAVKSKAPGYRILVFSADTIVDDGNPMHSAVILAPSSDPTEDGLLDMRKFAGMSLSASSAVFPQAATVNSRSGEGYKAVVWALWVAGCPSSVTSQWKAPKKSRDTIMDTIYHNFVFEPGSDKGQESLAEMIRQASLKMIGTKSTRPPLNWAGFFVLGTGF